MRFLLSISTKNKTWVIGHEGKDFYRLLAMITSILIELLKIVSKDDILNCLKVAEEHSENYRK